MIQVSNVGLRYGDRKLFEDVNIKFNKLSLLKPFYEEM
ncbi:ABC transport system ATP-binding protein [Lysinibacillus sphaericus OT4b.31]|uniref:ABC transport system ATP-binding protein n=1 Tax=Lysinibacillus sphaericus OT4b.31 TaxID=1285586 RepID=R7ZDP4_LYSSH|nr:ABC transport system ATP-binding protein [Lysinibacillus sphaericus OT4b.31]